MLAEMTLKFGESWTICRDGLANVGIHFQSFYEHIIVFEFRSCGRLGYEIKACLDAGRNVVELGERWTTCCERTV